MELKTPKSFYPGKTPSILPNVVLYPLYGYDLDVMTILSFYSICWHIETGYQYFKDLLGFDQYQMLSYKGIQRFWCIQFLVYNCLEYQRKHWVHEVPMAIGDVVRRIRENHLGQLVVYAYEQGLVQKPLAKVLEGLKLPA